MLEILEEYLMIYPDEKDIQMQFMHFLKSKEKDDLFDIRSSKGHITASGVVYCIKTNSLLLLEHKFLNKWYSPGGHRDSTDNSMLETAKRELEEETGLFNLDCKSPNENNEMPFDIDTHIIAENKKNEMPEHCHHDFRYLFILDIESEIKIDIEESSNYKWVDINILRNNVDFEKIVKKIDVLLKKI